MSSNLYKYLNIDAPSMHSYSPNKLGKVPASFDAAHTLTEIAAYVAANPETFPESHTRLIEPARRTVRRLQTLTFSTETNYKKLIEKAGIPKYVHEGLTHSPRHGDLSILGKARRSDYQAIEARLSQEKRVRLAALMKVAWWYQQNDIDTILELAGDKTIRNALVSDTWYGLSMGLNLQSGLGHITDNIKPDEVFMLAYMQDPMHSGLELDLMGNTEFLNSPFINEIFKLFLLDREIFTPNTLVGEYNAPARIFSEETTTKEALGNLTELLLKELSVSDGTEEEAIQLARNAVGVNLKLIEQSPFAKPEAIFSLLS